MSRLRIAVVAHDNKKQDLIAWVRDNLGKLIGHEIIATGTTGALVERELGVEVLKLQSGPLGGDQQLGARIAAGEIDILVFFWDPLDRHPHDPDVVALLRMAVIWNIPFACNRSTADYLFSSPHLSDGYARRIPDFTEIRERPLP
jgi:methylglyoxal synthase